MTTIEARPISARELMEELYPWVCATPEEGRLAALQTQCESELERWLRAAYGLELAGFERLPRPARRSVYARYRRAGGRDELVDPRWEAAEALALFAGMAAVAWLWFGLR